MHLMHRMIVFFFIVAAPVRKCKGSARIYKFVTCKYKGKTKLPVKKG